MPYTSRTTPASRRAFRRPGRLASSRALAWTGGLLAVLLVLSLGPHSAIAQGFGVFEQGACVMSRAEATVADACGDGSSIFYNPANLVSNEGIVISLGGTSVAAGGEYQSGITGQVSELQNDPIYVPHFFASYRVNESLAAGLGAYVPYGLATEWDRSFEGAFEGYDNGVEAIYIQPTVSYRINERLRVGAGPIIAISRVELNQLVDLSAQEVPPNIRQDPLSDEPLQNPLRFSQLGVPHHTAFADTKLEGSGEFGFGANLGVTYSVSDRLHIGARFTTPITVTYDGDATFEQIETGITVGGANLDQLLELTQFDPAADDAVLVDQSIETELTFPAQVIVGVSVNATERIQLLLDYQWNGWSSLGEIPLDFEKDALDDVRELNYDNTSAIRFGAQYDLLDNLTLRGGYLFNTAAAPDATVTPLLPEANRNHFTLGFSYQPVDLLDIGVAYQRLNQYDRIGRVRDARPGEEVESLAELNEGLYSFGANLIGVTLTVRL